MAHDVFISASSDDKPIADAVCATLETHGIRCWIAPRDILVGEDWSAAIINGLERSRLLVLVFSSHANRSQQIKREVERAVNKGLIIVPFRIEEVAPTKSLEYFLGTPHWLDALTPPLESHLERLAETVKLLLERESPAGVELRRPAWPKTGKPRLSPKVLLAAGAGLALAAVLFVKPWLNPPKVNRALVGAWTADGPGAYDSHWKIEWNVAADGTYQKVLHSGISSSLRRMGRSPELLYNYGQGPGWPIAHIAAGPGSVRVLGASATIDESILDTMAGALSEELMFSPGSCYSEARQPWARQSSDSDKYLWTRNFDCKGEVWKYELQIAASGDFALRGSAEDSGEFYARGGKWKAISKSRNSYNDGDYQLIDKRSVMISGVVLPTSSGNSPSSLWHKSSG